jgi:flagellar hook-length control protein FliK
MSPAQSSVVAGLAVEPAKQSSPNQGTSTPAAAEKGDGQPSPSATARFEGSPTELPSSTAAGPVHLAQMVSKAAQVEMRIGLNTTAFGSVEVRTIVHANDVGVQIGSERGDLRSLLANDLPAIANTLQQQNLRLSQVNFHQAGFGSSGNPSSGGDSQQRAFAPRPAIVPQQFSESISVEAASNPESRGVSRSSGLSILA